MLLRGSVVKRIDPNHYDMSRLCSAASTMAGSSSENETPRAVAQLGLTIKSISYYPLLDSLGRYAQVVTMNRNRIGLESSLVTSKEMHDPRLTSFATDCNPKT